jgi:hypothetical protein
VQREVLHVEEELLVDRPVEPKGVTDLRDQLGRGLPARAQSRGVGGRERVEDQEGHRADDHEHRHRPEQPPHDVERHRGRQGVAERPARACRALQLDR